LKNKLFLSLPLLILSIGGCSKNSQLESHSVNFAQMQWFANRASVVYSTAEEIKSNFPLVTRVATVKGTKVQYFIELLDEKPAQVVAIRGTANLKNAIIDAEYLQSNNRKLGVFVHKGFDADTYLLYQDLLPHLDKSKEVILTGHSLGAAISTLLMMYLHEDGFKLGLSINFGQPKVTNKVGADKYANLPLLRVIDENDVVPLLPPSTLVDSVHGIYHHIGKETILLEGQYYVFQDQHLQRSTGSNSFWENLLDESVAAHFIKHYLHNIKSKLNDSKQIPFSERDAYIDN
jgi:predicted lipase